MNIKEFFRSHAARGVLYALGIVIVALMIFQAGVSVGYYRSLRFFRMTQSYEREFPPAMRMHPSADPFSEQKNTLGFKNPFIADPAHGAFGVVQRMSGDMLLVVGPDGSEKTVWIASGTPIRKMRDMISEAEMREGDRVIVIGEPDENGVVRSRFIRVMPPADALR